MYRGQEDTVGRETTLVLEVARNVVEPYRLASSCAKVRS